MISIIVPVYNVKEYLIQCLESINSQTYKDYEVIVVDDGSTDGSGKMVDDFCADKPKFKVFHKENEGLMSAWLYGVENSQGDYIGFVDSDDMIVPTMYEKMIEVAEKKQVDIVMCGRKDITKNTTKDSIDNFKEVYTGSEMEYIYEHVFPSLREGNISSARWNKVYKREVLIPNLKYCVDKSRYCEDRYIVPATLLTARSFAYIPEPLYIYRMRKSANSKTSAKKLYPSLVRLFEIQERMLKDKGLFNKYNHKIEVSKLDYIKLVFERNIVNSSDSDKISIAKEILSNENRKIILENKKECVNKFGKAIYIIAKLNAPGLLVFVGKIYKLITKKEKESWY